MENFRCKKQSEPNEITGKKKHIKSKKLQDNKKMMQIS